MRSINGNVLEIVEGPHRIVVNAHAEYRPTAPGQIIDGYRVSVRITRTDRTPVFRNFVSYDIPQGGIYLDLNGALSHGEHLARQAIADGFPDN